jgi:integrase
MTAQPTTTVVGQAELDAALLLLARMGITPHDLLRTSPPRAAAPTFAEYVPMVSAAVTQASRKAYTTYWRLVVDAWGDRGIDEPTPSEIRALIERLRASVVTRRNSRGGHGGEENLITALRCLYRHAVADGYLTEAENPASKVDKPRRNPSPRIAEPDARLAEINQVAASTGNDPVLDMLILRLHVETACRRGGALALRPCDLDEEQCLVLLHEKGDTTRRQPVSPTLMAHLQQHADERHAPADGRLLRYRDGDPITHCRYDYLWKRIGEQLPWVASQQVSTHWLRHTTLTWVERNFGSGVARAYAGHSDRHGDATTTTYIKATLPEVAAALAALTGEPHPLAPPGEPVSGFGTQS